MSGSTGQPSACEGAPVGVGDACPDETPYCFESGCVGCGALPVASCEAIDPALPACNPDSGQCVECTGSNDSQCGGLTPVCVDDLCAPCTVDEQCASGICLIATGACQPVAVELDGIVHAAELTAAPPVADVDVFTANLDPQQSFLDTPPSGAYSLGEIPPGSLLDVALDIDEGWAGDPNSAFRTVHELSIGLEDTQTQDLSVVRYEWLGEVALACELYDFGDGGIGPAPTTWDVLCNPGPDDVATPGCFGAGEGVGSFIVTRSTVVGTLFEDDGVTPFTTPLSRGALSVLVSNNGVETANVESNPGDTDPFPFHVCWLDMDNGELVGSPATHNQTGHFVLFRLRNDLGLGQGTVTVEASGFDAAHVSLASSGSVGVVALNRNDEEITRDFALDVYPMFEEWGCLVCHSTGGIGAVEGERDGFFADWSLSPQAVYDNIVGPGTVCDTTVPLDDPTWGTDEGLSSGRLRVCVNRPEESLLIMRPSAGLPLFNEVHPVDIFPGPEHPQLQIVREWVEQGANPPANVPVDFTTDVYPIFTTRGCVACHTGCQSAEPGIACVLDSATDTFFSDWNLPPADVYQNLVGPGTNCTDPDNDPLRVCVNAPEASLLVVRPLAGVPENDPHPIDIFASEDDPDLQTFIAWITQGAPP